MILITVLLHLLVGCHGDRDVGLGFEFREYEILAQVLKGLARARGFLIEEVSGPHTFEGINLIYFSPLHNSTLVTIHNRRPFTQLSFFPSRLFDNLPSNPSAPSEIGFYIRSDDVILPEPSVSRSFSHFPCCSQSRECSGSFFTWLVGWVTDTPRRLS
jgi:hypothetical protein